MAARPPKGYDRRDKPLPHVFEYSVGLEFGTATTLTYLRNSIDTVNPETIMVNPRHASYAIDTGPCVCSDSLVEFMTIQKTYTMGGIPMNTDNIPAIACRDMKIFGCWEDNWTPTDEDTGASIASILNLTSDLTKEDVVPLVAGSKTAGLAPQPLSTITMAEVFGDYNLTTNSNMEVVAWNEQQIYNALHFFTNGAKLKTTIGQLRRYILSRNRTHASIFQRMRVPRKCFSSQPHLYFGDMFSVPAKTDIDQVTIDDVGSTAGDVIQAKVIVRFDEWNKAFDQSRQGA